MARLTARKLASQPLDELAGLYRATRNNTQHSQLERRHQTISKTLNDTVKKEGMRMFGLSFNQASSEVDYGGDSGV